MVSVKPQNESLVPVPTARSVSEGSKLSVTLSTNSHKDPRSLLINHGKLKSAVTITCKLASQYTLSPEYNVDLSDIFSLPTNPYLTAASVSTFRAMI
jgi:hypothetical protein